jgi:HK97 family phage major capsid protein
VQVSVLDRQLQRQHDATSSYPKDHTMDFKSSAQAELSALKVKLSNIADAAKNEHRDLTDAEIKSVDETVARVNELKYTLDFLEKGDPIAGLRDSTAGQFTTFDNGIGGAGETVTGSSREAKGYITASSIKSMVQNAAPQAAKETKAFVAVGTTTTAVTLDNNPIKLGTPPVNLGLLGVIPVTKRSTPSYKYLRQTVRTNNAAVVPAGSLKPTSVLTSAEVENTLAVVAHMSEYVSTYILQDNENLNGFLTSELTDGIFAKVTALAVAAYAGTAGITTQAFSSNIMDSLYLGASKVADLGYNPDTVLITRANLDTLALAKDTAGNYLYRSDIDNGRLGTMSIVVVSGLAANTALVLDSNKVGISTDTAGLLTKWDAYTRFDYNETRALVEGRFAFDVYAAPAIVRVATSA